MPLPIIPLATDVINVGGTDVSVRAMKRSEALALNSYKGREDEAEVFILMCGTGCTEEEAQAFRGNDTETAGLLIDGILILSKLAPGAADPKANTSGPS